MLRVFVRLPSRRGLRCKFTVVAPQLQRSRIVAAEASLADRFNLASLNGGKNPFETASDRLLRTPTKKPKNDTEMKDVYSLDYLLGKNVTKSAATKETKAKKNPFDVASAKLM